MINFCDLNVIEDGVECKSFKVTSIDCLLVYENKYYRIYLDNNPFETDEY